MRRNIGNGWAVAFAAFITMLAAAACDTGQAEEAPGITTTEVVRNDLRLVVEATGTVEPVRTVEVKSKASGEILRLYVDTGDELDRGALIAEIDPRDVRNDYNQAEADLNVAVARLDISRAQLERSTELLAAGVITEQEHESANLDYANAQATLVKATTSKELAELRLSDVTIRAPMDGTIIQKSVEEGQVIQSASQNVSGGTTLFMMANLEEMQVRTLVDETDVGQISSELSATVTVEAFPGQIFQGVVDKIEPQAEVQQNVTMFPVIVTLDNRNGLLKPGMNAEVEVLVAERQQALLVPNNTIVQFQEMAPAAMVLGMDPDAMEMDRSVFGELRQSMMTSLGGTSEGLMESPGEAPAGEGRGARIRAIQERVASGEISQDSARALALQGGPGGGGGARGGQGFRSDGGRPGGGQRLRPGGGGGGGRGGGGRGAREQPGAPRQAITFVVAMDGAIEARPILIGVNDWDNTEVLAGLEEGEHVALIGAAQLLAQQQEFIDRMRERMGGNNPFGGGGGPRGGRR